MAERTIANVNSGDFVPPPDELAVPERSNPFPPIAPEHLIDIFNEPDFQSLPYEKRRAALTQALSAVYDYGISQPDFKDEHSADFGKLADMAYAKLDAEHTVGEKAGETGKFLVDTAKGFAKDIRTTAVAAISAASQLEPGGVDPTKGAAQEFGKGFALGGAKLIDSAAHLTDSWFSPADNELKDSISDVRKEIDEGKAPVSDPAKFADWLRRKSAAVLEPQTEWTATRLSLMDPEFKGNAPKSARANQLASPLNAGLVGAYIRTRDPKKWEQLQENLATTPLNASFGDEARKITESKSGKLIDEVYGEGSSEHLLSASDPLMLATYLIPTARAAMVGKAVATAEGGFASRLGTAALSTAKALPEQAAIGAAMTLEHNPEASTTEVAQGAGGMMLAGTVMHVGGVALGEVARLGPKGETPIPLESRAAVETAAATGDPAVVENVQAVVEQAAATPSPFDREPPPPSEGSVAVRDAIRAIWPELSARESNQVLAGPFPDSVREKYDTLPAARQAEIDSWFDANEGKIAKYEDAKWFRGAIDELERTAANGNTARFGQFITERLRQIDRRPQQDRVPASTQYLQEAGAIAQRHGLDAAAVESAVRDEFGAIYGRDALEMSAALLGNLRDKPPPAAGEQVPPPEADAATSGTREVSGSSPPPVSTSEPVDTGNNGVDGGPAQVGSSLGGDPLATSNKEAVVNAERAAQGLEPVPKDAPISNPDLLAQGRAVIEQTPNAAENIAAKLRNATPEQRTISREDAAVLGAERVRLQTERDAQADIIADEARPEAERSVAKAKWAETEAKIGTLDQAAQDARSVWGGWGNFWQQLIKRDFTFEALDRKERVSRPNNLTPKEIRARTARVKEQADQHAAITKQEEEQRKVIADIRAETDKLNTAVAAGQHHVAKLETLLKQAGKPSAKRAAPKATPDATHTPKPVGGKVRAFIDEHEAAAMARVRERRGRFSANIDPTALVDEAIIGAAKLSRQAIKFGAWSAEMLRDVGDYIKPHLEALWKASKARLAEMVKAAPRDIDAERAATIAGIKSRLAEGDKPADLHRYAEQLARQFIDQGITELDPLSDAVHGALKEAIPKITPTEARDAWTGFGEWTPLDKAPEKVIFRQRRAEGQAVSKIELYEKGQPAPKTGQEREAPTELKRALEKKAAKLAKDMNIEVTDKDAQLKSSLDAVKTRLKNEIADMDFAMSQKPPKRMVKDKSGIDYDTEAKALKAARDAKKAEYDVIFPKEPITAAEQLRRAEMFAERNLDQWQKKLADAKAGKIPKQDGPILGPKSRRLQELDDQTKAAKAQVDELKMLANPKRSATEIAIQSRKTEALNRIAELGRRTAAKEFGPPVKAPVAGPKTLKEAKAQAYLDAILVRKAKVETEFRMDRLKDERSKRNRFQKATGAIANLNRVGVLSHLSVLEHLSGAAIENIATRPVGTALAQLFRFSKTLDAIRRKAVYEGHGSISSEVTGILGTVKSAKAVWEKLTKGKSQLDWLHGAKLYPKQFGEIVGNVHAAIKEPVRQGIYARSMQLRVEAAEKMGLDPAHDPVLRDMLSMEAYKDANMDIFMGDNFLTKALHGVVTGYLRGEKSSPGLAKFTADVLDLLFPVVNVSTNIAIRKLRLAIGLPEAAVRIGVAAARGELAGGAAKLSPRDAELIVRAFKYGTFGAALGLYAWNHPKQFGGIYVPGKNVKRDKTTGLDIGDIGLPGGGHISHHFAHGPVGGYMNLIADARRLYDEEVRKNPSNKWSAMTEATFFSMFAGIKDIPTFGTVGRLTSPFKSAGQKTGEMLKNMFVAGAIQDVAKATDKKERSPKNFVQEIESGIPGLRQRVPEKKK